MDESVEMRDTTFDNVVPTSVWLDYDNQIHGKDRFVITLNINGVRKNIMDFYIPGLAQDEGHTCGGNNLTWIYEAQIKRIAELEAELASMTLNWHNCSALIMRMIRRKTVEDVRKIAESGKHLIWSTVLRNEGINETDEFITTKAALKDAVELVEALIEETPDNCDQMNKARAFLESVSKND